jgi:apolipoprotein D and lipocalin family protein
MFSLTCQPRLCPKRGLVMQLKALTALIATMALLFVSASVAQMPAALTTVERVDLNRYIGQWYEIALFPNRFQKQCVADTTATYALKENGRIQVTNRCRLQSQAFDTALGEAKLAVDDGSTAKLKVRFAPVWLSWLDRVWGNYWVIELEPNYEHVVISEPNREFLWILARKPRLSEATLNGIKARLIARGFDVSKLQFTPQGVAQP